MSASTAWLSHALCTDPADRPAAEEAVTQLYAQLNKPPPTFVWIGSPAAAVRELPPARPLSIDGPWALENDLATLYSETRRGRPSWTDPLRRTVRETIVAMIRAQARADTTDRLGDRSRMMAVWHASSSRAPPAVSA